MKEILHVAFHREYVRLLDGKLNCISQVNWEDQLPVSVVALQQHSIASNHKDWELNGFIMAFQFLPKEIDKVQRKSVYSLGLSGDQSCEGETYFVTRLKIDESGKCLKPYNEQTEAMIFENECPAFLLEYGKNELFVTNGTQMCLVHDW